jgi:hypothetical protein
MDAASSLTAAVRRELLAHPDVTEGEHRFGGIVFHVGRLEIGHLHGETVADLPFPPHIRDELLSSGRLSADHVEPDSSWVSRRVNRPEDVAEIVELFRVSYEYAASRAAQLAGHEDDSQATSDGEHGRGASWRDGLPWPRLRRRSRRR